MANAKEIKVPHATTGETLVFIVKREADGYLLNDADGVFASAPADPWVLLTEHATLKGLYEKSESRTAWNDGKYTITAYVSTDLNTIIASGSLEIINDLEITPKDLHDNAFGTWTFDRAAKTLTLLRVDGSVLKVFDLTTIAIAIDPVIARTPQ